MKKGEFHVDKFEQPFKSVLQKNDDAVQKKFSVKLSIEERVTGDAAAIVGLTDYEVLQFFCFVNLVLPSLTFLQAHIHALLKQPPTTQN